MRLRRNAWRGLLLTRSALAVTLIFGGALHPAVAAGPEERRAYQILLASEAEAAKVRKEILAQGGGLKRFRAAARKYSKDVFTKRLGGDLGWNVRVGRLHADFADALFGLEVGALSRSVETDLGWHLIFCAHRRAGGVGETSPGDDSEKAEEDEETLDRGETIVRRYLRVAGGEKAFRRIRDRTEKFRNIKYSLNGQTTARLSVYMKRGYKFREDWLIENFQINGKELRFVQVYDGDEGWVQMTGTVSPLEGRTLAVFIWDKYLDNFFMQWKQDGYRLSYEGREDADGEAAEVVQMADFTGKHSVRYYFSRANGLVLKKEWVDTTGKQAVTKEQFYRDYEKVEFADGSGLSLRLPRKLVVHADGKLDTERLYDEVALNTGLEDKLFGRPEGKPFVPKKKTKR